MTDFYTFLFFENVLHLLTVRVNHLILKIPLELILSDF